MTAVEAFTEHPSQLAEVRLSVSIPNVGVSTMHAM